VPTETNVLLTANSNLLEVNGLRNGLTNSFVNTALVIATLEDLKGNEIGGQIWPVTLAYVAGSDGCYRTTFAADLTIENEKQYKLTLVVQGDGLDAHWDKFIQAKDRQ
jgi:hypothetical protein